MTPEAALVVLGLLSLVEAVMWLRSHARRILGLGIGRAVFA